MSKQPEQVTEIWQNYKAGIDYQRNAGFSAKWPEFERFKALDQWPAPTEATKNLPRPVIDITNYIIGHKVSNTMSSALKMAFIPKQLPRGQEDFVNEAAETLTNLAAETWYDLEQDELNALALDDAATIGAGHWHYYWDPTKGSKFGTRYIGDIAGEIIDSSCIFYGDPQNTDVQTQPRISIASRMDTDLAKEMLLRAGADKSVVARIEGDGNDDDVEIYDRNKERLDGEKKTTIITQYTRKNGIVHMAKSVKRAVVIPPTPMKGMTRYPIECFQWERQKRCIYGRSELAGVIPVQKAINLLYALMIMCCQDIGFPKLVVYPGALRGQTVTGKMGQMITNYLSNPQAIQYLNGGQFNNAVFGIVDNLIGYAKSLHGVSEGLTGERIASDMAVGAIMAIQAQARQPLKPKERAFYRSVANIGKIWEEFYKNYMDLPRPMVMMTETGKPQNRIFKGSDFKDVPFSLKVEVGPTSEFNESLAQSFNDRMYSQKDISADMYVELAPDSAYPNKTLYKRLKAQQAEQSGLLNNLAADGLIAPEALLMMGQAGIIPMQIAEPAAKTAIQAAGPPPQEGEMPLEGQEAMQGQAPA
jgi:hypothetical protein